MKRVVLYVGPPGSGKTTAARNECDFVIDDPNNFTTFDTIKWFKDGTRVGVTVPYLITFEAIQRFNEVISEHGAVLQTIVLFDGSDETLMHNVLHRGQGDMKQYYGLIRLWTISRNALALRHDILEHGDYNVEVRDVQKFA